MHRGAARSGDPKGNQNALKHGLFTRQMLEERAELSQLMREANATLKEIS